MTSSKKCCSQAAHPEIPVVCEEPIQVDSLGAATADQVRPHVDSIQQIEQFDIEFGGQTAGEPGRGDRPGAGGEPGRAQHRLFPIVLCGRSFAEKFRHQHRLGFTHSPVPVRSRHETGVVGEQRPELPNPIGQTESIDQLHRPLMGGRNTHGAQFRDRAVPFPGETVRVQCGRPR